MSKQVNTTSTKLVRIDSRMHYQLKKLAADEKTTIRELVEQGLAEVLSPLKGGEKHDKRHDR